MDASSPSQEILLQGTAVKGRALELLGNGCSGAQTAAALGVTDAYISQLLADEDFANKVAELRGKLVEAEMARDKNWDNFEDKVLAKLQELMPFVTKPNDLCRMAAVANGAKRRSAGLLSQQGADLTRAVVVVLQLPQALTQKFALNAQAEVTEVDGRPMATVSSHLLLKKVKEEAAIKDAEIVKEKVAKAIEGSSFIPIKNAKDITLGDIL